MSLFTAWGQIPGPKTVREKTKGGQSSHWVEEIRFAVWLSKPDCLKSPGQNIGEDGATQKQYSDSKTRQKALQEKENYSWRSFTNMEIKIFNKMLAKQSQQYIKRQCTMTKWDLFQEWNIQKSM